MRRIITTAMLAACLGAGDLREACAHGGRFVQPAGGIPPGVRPVPDDPTPPPAPDPTPTPTTGDDDGPPKAPASVTPPPPGPTTGGGGLGGTTRRGTAALDHTSWVWWYTYNSSALENVKRSIYALPSTNSLIAHVGGHIGNEIGTTQDVRTKVASEIIPTLLWVMDQGARQDPDLESAAYIALAKVTNDPLHIDLLLKGLDTKHDQIVTESAALGLGLLRRARASKQFSPKDLDRARIALFDVVENDRYATRERGFALMGLGLLGDQPSKDEAATNARLMRLLQADYAGPDLPEAILVAVSLQGSNSFTESQRETLRDIVTKGRLGNRPARGLLPSFAAQALGRIGTDKDVDVLRRSLGSRRTDATTRRSIAIGLGKLGTLVSGEGRVEIANTLIRQDRRLKDLSAQCFATLSLGELLVQDLDQGRTDVIGSTEAAKTLLQTAERGRYGRREFAALALGRVCRAIDPTNVSVEAYAEFRSQALDVLRKQVESPRLNARARAAYVTALGLARDSKSQAMLVGLVEDKDTNAELRGYAATALGLLGTPSPDVLRVIRGALGERRSEELRVRTARALGMLRDPQAVDLLLTELDRAESMVLKGELVTALGNIGDGKAVDPLVKLVRDSSQKDLTRAQACVGLGNVGDLEWIPSLQRLRADINFRGMNALLEEVTSIL